MVLELQGDVLSLGTEMSPSLSQGPGSNSESVRARSRTSGCLGALTVKDSAAEQKRLASLSPESSPSHCLCGHSPAASQCGPRLTLTTLPLSRDGRGP